MLRIRANPRIRAGNQATQRGCWSCRFRRQAALSRSGQLMPSSLLDGA